MGGSAPRETLADYLAIQRGTTYKRQLLGLPGPVLLGLATIQRNGGFRRDSLQTYGGDSPDKLLVRPGELYLSLKDVTQSADLLGAVARLPLDHPVGRLTQDTVKLEPRAADVPVDYLYWLLRTPQYRSYCRSHATGTTNLGFAGDDFLAYPAPMPTEAQRRLADTLTATGTSKSHQRAQASSILGLSVVMPPAPLLVQFHRTAEPLLARPLACRRESRTLAALRDTLLPKLISGELRVKNAEKFIGRVV